MRFFLIFLLSCLLSELGPAAEVRLISVGGAVSEIVCALGDCDKLVAVDTSSEFPASLKPKQTIGYSRALTAEGIVALRPTLVLLDEEAGPPSAIQKLKDLKVPLVTIPSGPTVVAAKQRMAAIAAALHHEERGAKLIADLDASLKAAAAKPADQKRVLFIYARGSKALMVAGDNTAAGTLIGLLGSQNAAQGIEGFKPLTAEAVAAAKPDLILMTSSGAASLGGVDGVFSLPGLKLTPAGAKKSLLLGDDLSLLTIGPRTGAVIEDLKAKLRPAKG